MMTQVEHTIDSRPLHQTLFSLPQIRNLRDFVYVFGRQKQYVPLIVDILNHTDDEGVRSACLHALSDHGADVLPVFEGVAKKGDPQSVWMAVTMYNIRRITLMELVRFLDKVYQNASEEDVRKAVVGELLLLMYNQAVKESRQEKSRQETCDSTKDCKECLDELAEFLNTVYFVTYQGLEYVEAFERARKALDRLYEAL